jgi:hypothetical protein
VDRVFPAIKSTKKQTSLYIITKTVAYIFSLIIDSVTLYHNESPNLRAHKATILQKRDSLAPDAFRKERQDSLISLILKVPCARGRPDAKIIKNSFTGKPAAVTDFGPTMFMTLMLIQQTFPPSPKLGSGLGSRPLPLLVLLVLQGRQQNQHLQPKRERVPKAALAAPGEAKHE